MASRTFTAQRHAFTHTYNPTQPVTHTTMHDIDMCQATNGLLSAVSWFIALEESIRNAAPLGTAITLIIEGAQEFSRGSSTLRHLLPHMLAPHLPTQPPASPGISRAAPRDTTSASSWGGAGAGVGGVHGCIPGAISVVVLSGAGGRKLGGGRGGEMPALCVGCKGAVRQVVGLQLGGGQEMRGVEDGGRGGGQGQGPSVCTRVTLGVCCKMR